MDKILIIIRKEYLSKVKTKSFLLITFLSPLFFALLIFAPLWLSQIKSGETLLIGVADSTRKYVDKLPNNDRFLFVPVAANATVESADHAALLVISDYLSIDPQAATLYSGKQINPEVRNEIRKTLEGLAREEKIASYNIDNLDQIIRESRVKIPLNVIKQDSNGENRTVHTEMALVAAMALSFLIYLFITLYGTQVMNSVIEEKSSRIVEILLSTVKPFQLLIGKIVGIALVGLTQFLLWGLLTMLITTSLSLFAPGAGGTELLTSNPSISIASTSSAESSLLPSINAWNNSLNWVELGGFFLLYFMGGYLLYASLFAAVGAAIDNPSDAQQFMVPLMVPLIFAIYAGIYGAQNPNGPLAFWGSLIPFTSPVVMMARLPFDVPLWEKILSLSLLAATFIGSTMLSARIYSNGVLMYGQKGSYKQIWKWLKSKNRSKENSQS